MSSDSESTATSSAATGDPSDAQSNTSGQANASTGIGFEQLLSLLTQFDPIEVAARTIDLSRRSAEAVVSVVDNLTGTLENLNRTTKRIDALLDEVEEPLKRLMPQVAVAMNALASLGDVATQLGDVSRKLNPLISLAENAGGLFGLKPQKPADPSAPRP